MKKSNRYNEAGVQTTSQISRELSRGRKAYRESIENLPNKLNAVQEKLDAERAKANPNPVVIERCEAVIERLKEVIGNLANRPVIQQRVR